VFSFIWDRLLIRLDDTSGSGRSELYQGLLDKYINSELPELIFGYGINSVQQYSKELFGNNYNGNLGVTAHSDWLQYMFDFGIFGIFFMIILHYHFLKLLFFNFKNKTTLLPPVSMSYIIFAFTTIYSFILNTPDAMFFGIVISVITVESRKIKF
jgi:O-antigen ligase